MFTSLFPHDPVFHHQPFMRNEVQYSLFHRIADGGTAIMYKNEAGNILYAQTPGYNAWLWVDEEVSVVERERQLRELICTIKNDELPGITSDPENARAFAEIYAEVTGKVFRQKMEMSAYYCDKIVRPKGVIGECRLVNSEHQSVVAAYMVGFLKEAMGEAADTLEQMPLAARLVSSGNLFGWIHGGELVSIANITFRSPRHGAINSVYTPAEFRKKGYASALVASLCDLLLHKEKLTPILYADTANPNSNKVYQSIGFTASGLVHELKFEEKEE
ncbi:GNAT family N-acetyltransferase [Paenibacillus sp. ACRRX]|uniref:GNAT family N-acetyltransferase n=1 Tax=unclassified Paenibacillus TaxID=185978 RepID=UPI001EF6A308|nr:MULTISPECIES: GNAT family N-acetyltransferase [unclassified Paenibacillus]MCG7408711.1 GNAT family N-acetyltransferase [Paenibacillus sp. ACRRX]MDK8183478.1 GNAT family N-acetyltransferase [Paenibacillus sp. UMB4589-SE434]